MQGLGGGGKFPDWWDIYLLLLFQGNIPLGEYLLLLWCLVILIWLWKLGKQGYTKDMVLCKEIGKELKFRWAHRKSNKSRPIMAKFNLFKEWEVVRKSPSALKGSKYYLHEQFSKEVSCKQRKQFNWWKRHVEKVKRLGFYTTLYLLILLARDAPRVI